MNEAVLTSELYILFYGNRTNQQRPIKQYWTVGYKVCMRTKQNRIVFAVTTGQKLFKNYMELKFK